MVRSWYGALLVVRPVMMTGGFWARVRGVNRSDKAKERNCE
jgi:hypothetical protein